MANSLTGAFVSNQPGIMGKSQNTLQLAAGMNGTREMWVVTSIKAFSLEGAPQRAAGFFTPMAYFQVR